ncbi:MAG TPA: MgtC/SapB family protein [Chitinophagaceae bacterium]
MEVVTEQLLKVLIALIAGACLGFEREFHDKPAGFRTLALICIGSAIFTIISHDYFYQDRVASNIVTGIGFLGAGVMLKEGLTVKGITTASTIWVTAAIGMTIGMGAYLFAMFELIFVLTTLVILNRFEKGLQRLVQNRSYEIVFKPDMHAIESLEQELKQMGVRFARVNLKKNQNRLVVYYRITAGRRLHDRISALLASDPGIEAFEV